MHEELHLFSTILGVADVVEQVTVAVDVDVGNHPSQRQEDLLVFVAKLLFWVAGDVHVMNFSDSLKMSCSVSRPNSLGP
jgi:hypothetical protein